MRISHKSLERISIEGNRFILDLHTDWVQFFKPKTWNWITFHFINLAIEKEQYDWERGCEICGALFGFGFRLEINTMNEEQTKKLNKKLKKLDKKLKKK